MNLQEFYTAVGGSYEEVFAILRKDERIVKFLKKFLADESYQGLCAAIDSGSAEDAFELSHKLKGVALNLGLKKLAATASAICEEYRDGTPGASVPALYTELKHDYEVAVSAIGKLAA